MPVAVRFQAPERPSKKPLTVPDGTSTDAAFASHLHGGWFVKHLVSLCFLTSRFHRSRPLTWRNWQRTGFVIRRLWVRLPPSAPSHVPTTFREACPSG